MALLPWKQTVWTHAHTQREWANSVPAMWQLDSNTKYITVECQSRKAMIWSLYPSSGRREGSLVFRCGVCGATQVICLHPGVHTSSAQPLCRVVWFQTLTVWCTHLSDPEDFTEGVNTPWQIRRLALHKNVLLTQENKITRLSTGTSGITEIPQIPALWCSRQTL